MRLGAVRPGVEQPEQAVLAQPKKYSLVEEPVPIRWREPVLETAHEAGIIHRLLIADHGPTETGMFDDDLFGPSLRLHEVSRVSGGLKEVEEG
jgi:hypothetical protein